MILTFLRHFRFILFRGDSSVSRLCSWEISHHTMIQTWNERMEKTIRAAEGILAFIRVSFSSNFFPWNLPLHSVYTPLRCSLHTSAAQDSSVNWPITAVVGSAACPPAPPSLPNMVTSGSKKQDGFRQNASRNYGDITVFLFSFPASTAMPESDPVVSCNCFHTNVFT